MQLSLFALWCSHSDKMLCLWLKEDSVRFVNILVRITWVASAQLLMPFGTALDVGSQWRVSCAVWLLFSSQTHTSISWAPSTLLQIVPLQNSWILLLPFKNLETQRRQFFLVYAQNVSPFFSASHFLFFSYGLSYSVDVFDPNGQMWLWLNLSRCETRGSFPVPTTSNEIRLCIGNYV